MTNDQFPMTNDGGRAQRAVKGLHGTPIRNWSLAIGIWSFPAIIRDVSLVVPAGVRIQDVENALWEAAPKILADTDLFDDYEGEGMPDGKKSLAFHLIFQSEERTLTDAEVNREFDKIVKAVKAKGWEVR